MYRVAIVGRPNVGKSTLFNRLTRKRKAIVGNEPGITRDRLFEMARWNGKQFEVIDTGGLIPDQKEIIPERILQQAEIFDYVRDLTGEVPPVLDAKDVLTDPRKALGALCQCLGIEFCDEMLAWLSGPRDSDGVWAPYWYDAVQRSTGFQPWRPREGELAPAEQAILDVCQPHYGRLRKNRLRG